jgi:hypothetical protein
MWFRRAFYWVQLGAVVVLPLWIVVARAISSTRIGALDLLVFLAWPALALTMLAVLGLTWARKTVRATKTLSWLDVAALSAWYVVTITFGTFVALSSELGVGLTGGLLSLVSIGVVWASVWQLVNAARQRVRTVLAGLDYAAIPAGEYQASRFARGDGDVFRIDQSGR